MTGMYNGYDEFYRRFPDLYGIRKGGNKRAETARRVSGKFAPDNPDAPFTVDPESHRRGGIAGGRKRKAQVEVLGLRDPKTGRFIKEE